MNECCYCSISIPSQSLYCTDCENFLSFVADPLGEGFTAPDEQIPAPSLLALGSNIFSLLRSAVSKKRS